MITENWDVIVIGRKEWGHSGVYLSLSGQMDIIGSVLHHLKGVKLWNLLNATTPYSTLTYRQKMGYENVPWVALFAGSDPNKGPSRLAIALKELSTRTDIPQKEREERITNLMWDYGIDCSFWEGDTVVYREVS